MLVLSRKSMERIPVGDNMVAAVLEIRGGHERIGLSTPTDNHFLRDELRDAKRNVAGARGVAERPSRGERMVFAR